MALLFIAPGIISDVEFFIMDIMKIDISVGRCWSFIKRFFWIFSFSFSLIVWGLIVLDILYWYFY